MKILSHQEAEYIRNPGVFSKEYGYVIKHRIKKKSEDMHFVLDIIDNSGILLSKKQREILKHHRRKEEWHQIVREAMNKLLTIDEKLWKSYYDEYNSAMRDRAIIEDNKKMNEALWKYQREIVRIIFGDEILVKEFHDPIK